jgi:hypothetical protein
MEEPSSENVVRTNLRYRTSDISRLTMGNWHPVWVSSIYDNTDPKISVNEHVQMARWCEENCTDDWSEGWWQEDLAFWFRSKYDAVFFGMVWR